MEKHTAITATIKEVILMDFEGDFDDFFDMDEFDLAFALGMAETIAEEELERIRAEREFGMHDEDKLFED